MFIDRMIKYISIYCLSYVQLKLIRLSVLCSLMTIRMLIISITIIGAAFFQLFSISGPFPAILGKGPWPQLGKMIDLASKLGENNHIEHDKGSKIYPQNQVILECIMPSIPLKHKYLSIILIWVSVSHK